jgi:hypothetical protein
MSKSRSGKMRHVGAAEDLAVLSLLQVVRQHFGGAVELGVHGVSVGWS